MDEPIVTEEYLLTHGFVKYHSREEGQIFEIPFEDNRDSLHFKEAIHDRQMFVVIFSPYNGDPKEGYGSDVFVQIDAGCGFIEIPFPWWDLSVEYFESVYYGIRGLKPKPTEK